MRRAFLLLFLVACGGKLAPTSDNGSSGSSNGGTTSGGIEDGCSVSPQVGNRACVPGQAAANTPLSIDIDQTQSCMPCFATMDPCTVVVSGKQITVGMQTRTCGSTRNRVCSAICALPATTCELPPLSPGTYTVSVEGEGENGLARELVVADFGTQTSCELVRPAPTVGPYVLSKYDRTCRQASDCVAIPSLLCRACACEDAAIATSSLDTFRSDFRTASSQCEPQPAGSCAPCPRLAVACVAGRCQTGT